MDKDQISLDDNRPAIDRMKMCLQCEHFFKPTRQCKKCGCFMPIKVRLKGSSCPVGKW
jgi:hypothetical protein